MLKILSLLSALALLPASPVWAARYVDNLNGTVTDTRTKLLWQQTDDGAKRSWEQAITYCEDLSLAGEVNWRLPNFRALQSIVDDTKFNPAMDPVFIGAKWDFQAAYWSSTTIMYTPPPTPPIARAVEFANGNSSQDAKVNNYFYVRCVSGGL